MGIQKYCRGGVGVSDHGLQYCIILGWSPQAQSKGTVKPLAWFPNNKPLRSGWAWGQSYLLDGVAAFVANIGSGKLLAFGPEITFRAQTHGTFKFIFNQLYTSGKGR